MGAPKKKVPVKKTAKAPPKKSDAAKRKAKAKSVAIPKPLATESGCSCPECCCTESAGGAIKSCEDGVCVDINVPSYPAVLYYDPMNPSALPYWEKPANLPPAFLNAMLSNLDSTGLTILQTALMSYIGTIASSTAGSVCASACGP